jgi:hypothetical protein
MEYKLPFTAKEVEERLAQFDVDTANNVLNITADTTNFGDAASIGVMRAHAIVNTSANIDVLTNNSLRLYFNFVAGGVEYDSIEWTYEFDGTGWYVYYYNGDSRNRAYGYNSDYYQSDWTLPSKITFLDISEFREIYNNNTGCFTSYTEIKGVKVANTVLTDDTIAALNGLEVIGSFRITDIIAEYQNNVTFRNAVHKAMFMEIRGVGNAIYPVFANYGSSAGVYVGWCEVEGHSLTLPNHGVSTSPYDGKYAVTLYR